MRLIRAASIVAVVLVCFAATCTDVTRPSERSTLCTTTRPLYCRTALAPQTVPGGTCCATAGNRDVGYLCAFGSDKQAQGCAISVEEARALCPTAPSIVRCERE